MTMSLRALLFDVDGTLADTEEVHRRAFNAAFAQLGFDWQWDVPLYRDLLSVAGGKERLLHYWERLQPQILRDRDGAELASAVHAVKTEHYARLVATGSAPLRPGVARLLHQAHARGFQLGIVTTTSADNVTALLQANLGRQGLAWFSAIGAGDAVARKKPAPDIYYLVMGKIGVYSDECLAFEDSNNGLRAAQAAGVATVVTPTGYSAGEDFSGALIVLPHLGEPHNSLPQLEAINPGHGWVEVEQLVEWHTDARERSQALRPIPTVLTAN